MLKGFEGTNDVVLNQENSKYFERARLLEEEQKLEQLNVLLLSFYQKNRHQNDVVLPDGYVELGYYNDYGYYVLTDDNCGEIRACKLGNEVNDAFKTLICNIMLEDTLVYTSEHYDSLKEGYKEYFNGEDNVLGIAYTLYALGNLYHFYGNDIPDDLVNNYTGYLNSLMEDKEEQVTRQRY